jgi:chemotaxis response regulator CheB
MSEIKVLIIDDSALVRQVLSAIINDTAGIKVIATAHSKNWKQLSQTL